MRKIEQQMMNALREGKDWKGTNTEVRTFKKSYDIRTTYLANVYLFGNHIASTTCYPSTGYIHAAPVHSTFAHYPTSTTRSRLCALGVNASIRNRAAHIDGMQVR